METLKKHIDGLQNFSVGAFAISVKTKTSINNDTIMKGLESISKMMPELSESSFDEKEKEISLKNSESKTEKQILFKISELNQFAFGWGIDCEINLEDIIGKLFQAISNDFNILPINIEYIDFNIYLFADYKGDHYQLISDTFYKDALLANLFEKNKTLGNDIFLRGSLNDKVITIVRVDSGQGTNEILDCEYESETLRTVCSSGQVKGFGFNSNLVELFKNHYELSLDFVKNKFIPNIIIPLDNSISSKND